MKRMTKQEFIASIRRKSSGFSRGASVYRGVTRHHQQGQWQARIGCVAGNKDLYLGTFATEEEATEAYDIAAIKFRGVNEVTNFEMNRYDVETIMKSALSIGGAAKRLKLSLESEQKQYLLCSSLQTQYSAAVIITASVSGQYNSSSLFSLSLVECHLMLHHHFTIKTYSTSSTRAMLVSLMLLVQCLCCLHQQQSSSSGLTNPIDLSKISQLLRKFYSS